MPERIVAWILIVLVAIMCLSGIMAWIHERDGTLPRIIIEEPQIEGGNDDSTPG